MTKNVTNIKKNRSLTQKIKVESFPDLSFKNTPLATPENLEHLINQYGISCRYNQVKRKIDIDIPNFSNTKDLSNGYSYIATVKGLCAKNGIPPNTVDDHINNVAIKNTYNPVRDWIVSKPWDGISRIESLMETVESEMENAGLKELILKKWFLSAVAAVFSEKKFSCRGVLVFTGSQSQGKSKWIKSLVPDDFDAVLEGAMVDPANKDTIINAVSHWIVELGELDATFRKADVSRLKAFVTNDSDKLRVPYGRTTETYYRRTVFFGSVNEEQYLVDKTGNSRWWTVPVTKVNYLHSIDMQQFWAEMYVEYQKNAKWWMTQEEEEALARSNKRYEEVDPFEERITSAYRFDDKKESWPTEFLTASEVCDELGIDCKTSAELKRVRRVIKSLTPPPKRKAEGEAYRMPHRIYPNQRRS